MDIQITSELPVTVTLDEQGNVTAVSVDMSDMMVQEWSSVMLDGTLVADFIGIADEEKWEQVCAVTDHISLDYASFIPSGY